MVGKDAHVIHENSVYDQSQHTIRWVLINVAAGTHRHWHVLSLNIHISEASPTEVKH